MNLSHWEKQTILFLKGHFDKEQENKSQNLTIAHFVAEYYDLNLSQVNESNTFEMLVSIYQKLVEEKFMHFELKYFLVELFHKDKTVSLKHAIDMLKTKITYVPVSKDGKKLFVLPAIDTSVFSRKA